MIATVLTLCLIPKIVEAQTPPVSAPSWPIDVSKTVMQPNDLSQWKGMTVITGGKGYADTPWGQVHYRDIGPHTDKTPIFLMHQAPFSMTEFTAIQEEFARRGYRAITVDLPGYGMSDEPKVQPTIADYAKTMMAVLDILKIDKVILAGHHTGASIAAAMAARYPDRVAAVILHGTPYYTAAEGAEILSHPLNQRVLKDNGSHFTTFFEVASGGPANRDKPKPLAIIQNATWAVLGYFMQGRDYGHIAAFSNNMGADLMKITAPTLIISDPSMLHEEDVAASKLRPNFSLAELPKTPGNSTVELAPLWTDTVIKFLDVNRVK